MKLGIQGGGRVSWASLPTRGGWIEIPENSAPQMAQMSLPTRGGWIEMSPQALESAQSESLPTRGGWIEMLYIPPKMRYTYVPPHTGRVD